jgi:hypothetical protein
MQPDNGQKDNNDHHYCYDNRRYIYQGLSDRAPRALGVLVNEERPVGDPNAASKEKDLSSAQCSTLKCEQQTGGGEEKEGGDNVDDRDHPVSCLLDRLIHCDARD